MTNFSSTPYDDVFRTMLNDCSYLILPVINEVFDEHYSGDEEIIFAADEHFLNRQDGEEEKRVTDSSFQVVGEVTKKYHFECQSTSDNSLLIRVFEYDSQIALDGGEIVGNKLTLTFPHTAVLFLRNTANTPPYMDIDMITPGGNVSYRIPVMNVQQYSLTDIFAKRLFFLLPFYIFTHEKRFKQYEADKDKLNALCAEYAKLQEKLEAALLSGEINEYTKCTICDMSNRVLEHIAKNYHNVRKGVQSVMGGKILDYEAKNILNRGITQGIAQGITQGIAQGIEKGHLDAIRKLMNSMGWSLDQAMTVLEIPMRDRDRYAAAIGN